MLDFDLSQFVESVTSIINAVFSCSCKHSSSCGPGTVTVTVCGCSVNRVQPTKTYQSRQLSQPLWHRPTGSDHAASRCLHRSGEDAALLPATCDHERSTLVWFTDVYWGFVLLSLQDGGERTSSWSCSGPRLLNGEHSHLRGVEFYNILF